MRTSNPDFFGSYGGRYVAETLRPALDRLEREWGARSTTPASGRARPPLAGVRRPAHPPHVRRKRHAGRSGARGSSSNSRGSPTRGRTRSTTRSARLSSRVAWERAKVIAETGAGPARGRRRRRLREARPPVPGLHGRNRHAAPETERVLDGAATGPRWFP